MKTTPPNRAPFAALVCVSALFTAAANTPAAPVPRPGLAAFPLANVSIQGGNLSSTYETPGTPFKRQVVLKAAGFGIGGFLAGFFAVRLAHSRRSSRSTKSGSGSGSTVAMIPVVFALGGAAAPQAHACINVEEQTLDQTYSNPYTNFTDTGWFTDTVRNALKANPADDPHLKANPDAYPSPPAPGVLESDEAARMIIRGNAAGALKKLQQIEADHPGLYQAAANMGTAYELVGDDENALKWIKTGIERNPQSHMNAEWLHVKILEAKIALKEDPAWLENNTITGLNPEHSSFDTLQGTKSGRGIMESMRSQATVRALFIKPTDVILARLLSEAAAFAMANDPASTPGLVALATEYGLPQAAADKLLGEFEGQKATVARKAGVVSPWMIDGWPWVVGGMCTVLGALVAVRRIQKSQTPVSSVED